MRASNPQTLFRSQSGVGQWLCGFAIAADSSHFSARAHWTAWRAWRCLGTSTATPCSAWAPGDCVHPARYQAPSHGFSGCERATMARHSANASGRGEGNAVPSAPSPPPGWCPRLTWSGHGYVYVRALFRRSPFHASPDPAWVWCMGGGEGEGGRSGHSLPAPIANTELGICQGRRGMDHGRPAKCALHKAPNLPPVARLGSLV